MLGGGEADTFHEVLFIFPLSMLAFKNRLTVKLRGMCGSFLTYNALRAVMIRGGAFMPLLMRFIS